MFMSLRVLITGGAGFIGRHLGARLCARGCRITVLDSFSEQIHGINPNTDLTAYAERTIVGDISDPTAVKAALEDQDAVVHLAAETGTGQSMYEVTRYERVNINGTAVLIEAIANQAPQTVRRIVVASSRAVYGEGAYTCSTHGVVFPTARTAEDLSCGQFEPRCPQCSSVCSWAQTTEAAPFSPSSFYGLSKQVQEQMVLMFAKHLHLSAYALRYQNVYGPGQSLLNPYTGILAIFSNLARQGKDINVFEDGLESRDFVYIDDVVDATARCVLSEAKAVCSLNVGSGTRTSVLDVANSIVSYFRSASNVQVSGAYRLGDIRHNVADIASAHKQLGFEPKWDFDKGLKSFLEWAAGQDAVETGFERSLTEMRDRGLLLSADQIHA
jgi:dTDP-L-rhamnose 4-epimerase